jgi:kinesin family protein 5
MLVDGRYCGATDTLSSFETQLQAVKERLEAAKVSSRNLPNSPSAQGGFSFGGAGAGAGARIAKPLRGGGGGDGGMAASIPILSSLQGGDNAGTGKRTSWFFNNRS